MQKSNKPHYECEIPTLWRPWRPSNQESQWVSEWVKSQTLALSSHRREFNKISAATSLGFWADARMVIVEIIEIVEIVDARRSSCLIK